jgi:hypothetical protein
VVKVEGTEPEEAAVEAAAVKGDVGNNPYQVSFSMVFVSMMACLGEKNGDRSSLHALENKKALVVGIANDQSIAYGCAKAFRELGAELAITFLNDKAKPYVAPLADELESSIFMPMDAAKPGELEAVFDRITREWGQLDILVHSIAFAPRADLQGGLLNCSAEGFSTAMDISCHSFIRMARLAAAADERWRHHVRDELPRSTESGSQL